MCLPTPCCVQHWLCLLRGWLLLLFSGVPLCQVGGDLESGFWRSQALGSCIFPVLLNWSPHLILTNTVCPTCAPTICTICSRTSRHGPDWVTLPLSSLNGCANCQLAGLFYDLLYFDTHVSGSSFFSADVVCDLLPFCLVGGKISSLSGDVQICCMKIMAVASAAV